jgi:hypothetical protein
MERFEKLFRKVGFQSRKVFRKGPRVWVVGGELAGRAAVFKTSFGQEDPTLLDEHLRREALFLKEAPEYLSLHLPAIYDYGIWEGRFWYLIEWIKPGKPQSLESSDFLMLNTFFTPVNLDWILEVLEGLKRFSQELSPELKKNFANTSYELSAYRRLLEPQGRKFFEKEAWEKTTDFLDKAEPVYNRFNQTTITHHEFYGSQILSSNASYKLCDWENVGWGHPLRDFTNLWIRAFKHSAWQNDFLTEFRAQVGLEEDDFETLFGVEKILQNFGNLGLPVTKGEKFFQNCVLEVVA